MRQKVDLQLNLRHCKVLLPRSDRSLRSSHADQLACSNLPFNGRVARQSPRSLDTTAFRF